VELVVLPGNIADTLARWAGENAPAVIVTTRRAHLPRALGRLTRLAAEHPGVSVLVLDPTSPAAGTVRAA
jgi:nucleotide-binding universal stress UspA family protein